MTGANVLLCPDGSPSGAGGGPLHRVSQSVRLNKARACSCTRLYTPMKPPEDVQTAFSIILLSLTTGC